MTSSAGVEVIVYDEQSEDLNHASQIITEHIIQQQNATVSDSVIPLNDNDQQSELITTEITIDLDSNEPHLNNHQKTVLYILPETVHSASKTLYTKTKETETKPLVNISMTLETDLTTKISVHEIIELNSVSCDSPIDIPTYDNRQQTVIKVEPETIYHASTSIENDQKQSNPMSKEKKAHESNHSTHISPLSGQFVYKEPSHDLSPSEVEVHMQMLEDIDIDMPKSNSQHKQKALSRIPYDLSKLRSKHVTFNLLRETRFRELLQVSYLARYIFCTICGAISFIFAAFLWRIVFRIDSCCIEGEDRRFHAMPFFFAFCSYFNHPLLLLSPMLFVILPTAGVRHRHRSRFILFFLTITLVMYLSYGTYAESWDIWTAGTGGAVLFGVVITCLYWGGYYAIWVAFPILCAASVAFGTIQAMDYYVWDILRKNELIFGFAYSLYLTCLQSIILKTMIYVRLPHRIRQCCYRCFPNCCCQTSENTGETPRYYEDEEKEEKNEEDGDEVGIDDENVEKNKKIIGKKRKSKISRHKKKHSQYRFKSEAELTIDDVWGNDITFFATGAVVVAMESMRVAGMVFVRNNHIALAINVSSNILFACLTRNNVYMEVIYKCCMKTENPPLSKFYAILFGVRYQAEYIPYYVLLLMNFTQYGPTENRYMKALGKTVDLPWERYWWMYIVLFGSEILSDIFAHFVKKFGRKIGWFGTEGKRGDPAREAKFVKLKLWVMISIFISFFSLSLAAYNVDHTARFGGVSCPNDVYCSL